MANKSKKAKTLISLIACFVVLAVLITLWVIVYQKQFGKTDGGKDSIKTVSTTESKVESVNTVSTDEKKEEDMSSNGIDVEEFTATMYPTLSSLNVRSGPGTDFTVIGEVKSGEAISVTGKCKNGWHRVDYGGKEGYCYGGYLSTDKNAASATQVVIPYYLKVNRTQNIVTVYGRDENGEYTVPVKAMVCSVGKDGKTPTGTYKTSDKFTWAALSGGVYGQYATRITGPYLFHSVPYFSHNKADLEYDEYNKLGEGASLGCVRLAVADAKWIFENCTKGTTVTIYDSAEPEPLARPEPIRIDTADSRKGWDPTDPDPANPWKQTDP